MSCIPRQQPASKTTTVGGWLVVENGSVVGIQGWPRRIVESLLALQAMTRRIPLEEVHRAFIHYAARYGEPPGDPVESVFLEWARVLHFGKRPFGGGDFAGLFPICDPLVKRAT